MPLNLDLCISKVSVYHCIACANCPLGSQCTKAKAGRTIQCSKVFWAYRAQSQERITSEFGTLLRTNRSIQSEGEFGILKEDWGFRRFLRRGMQNVFTEALLYAFALNVTKLHTKTQNEIQGVILHQFEAS